MAKKSKKVYWFTTSWLGSLILSVIPGINWWLGVIHRLVKGNILGAILFIPFGAVLGFIDFVTILFTKSIFFLA
jgi:hypothetical protein